MPEPHRPEVLFVCVHNPGRSQTGAALLTRHAGDAVVVRSAGADPSPAINGAVADAVADAMGEVGVEPRPVPGRPAQGPHPASDPGGAG